MFVRCWANVYYVGPALNKHISSVSYIISNCYFNYCYHCYCVAAAEVVADTCNSAVSCDVAATANAVDVYAAGLISVAAVATLTTVVADTDNSAVSCAAVAVAAMLELLMFMLLFFWMVLLLLWLLLTLVIQLFLILLLLWLLLVL